MKKLFVFFAVMFALLAFHLPAQASYTNIYLSGFQNIDHTKNLTGEIYYTNKMDGKSSFSYCVNRYADLPVPGSYQAEKFSIAGKTGLLQAAWLLDTYAFSKFGTFTGFSATQTGTIVQLAVWQVIGQPVTPAVPGYENLFTKKDQLIAAIPTTDLSYLADKYVKLDLYSDSAPPRTHYQDILTPVPVPAAFWLLGSGLIALTGISRRNRRSDGEQG